MSGADHDSEERSKEVELRIPGDAASVQLARLVGAGMAGRLGFDVEEIEDLRIAIDELCVAVVDQGVEVLTVRYRADGDQLTVEGRGTPAAGDGAAPTLDALSTQIVAAVADDHDLGREGDDLWFRVRKGRAAT